MEESVKEYTALSCPHPQGMHVGRSDVSTRLRLDSSISNKLKILQFYFSQNAYLEVRRVTIHRLGLAIVPLCRGTGAPPPFDEHRRPLAPYWYYYR